MTVVDQFLIHSTDIEVPGIGTLPRWGVEVELHDTAEHMQEAIAEHHDMAIAEFVDTAGAFSATEFDEDDCFGTLRLSVETLTREVVIHESSHIAVGFAHVFFRTKKRRPLKLFPHRESLREELIAYTAGAFADGLLRRMAEHIPAEDDDIEEVAA